MYVVKWPFKWHLYVIFKIPHLSLKRICKDGVNDKTNENMVEKIFL